MNAPDTNTARRCGLCGRISRRTCGLIEFSGRCGLPDPRKVDGTHLIGEEKHDFAHNPMHKMSAARAALALLKPCGAKCRRTGLPCKRPPCRGSTRCNLHGGRSTGAPVTSGKRTLKTQRAGHWVRLLSKVVALQEKPMKPRMVIRGPDGQWHPLDGDEG